VISLFVFAAREPAVTDSTGGPPPPGVSLELPASYVAISPLSRVLDTLTLLSNPQTFGLLGSVAAIVVLWTTLAPRPHGVKRLAVALVALAVTIALLEAAAALAPRPMARLRVRNPEIVTIDFHSHTGASHDVRKSYTAEDNRAWHRAAGFDIAYVSDHVKFDGALAARSRNPAKAGAGTSLLTAVEGRYHRIMSTIMLGLTEADTALLDRRGALLPGTPASGRIPVTIVALPNRNLDSVTRAGVDSLPRFAGIELVDAAPRGLAQVDREEERIRSLAFDLGLTLVAGSNNHGYGRTAAAWNLMSIPGWRNLPPDSVGRLIEDPLRNRRPGEVTIVRRLRSSLSGADIAWILPASYYQIAATLTPAERIVWIAWLLAGTAALHFRRARRSTEKTRRQTS